MSATLPVDLRQLHGDRHRHSHRGRRQGVDVDARADGGLAGYQTWLHGLNRRLLDEPDHVGRGQQWIGSWRRCARVMSSVTVTVREYLRPTASGRGAPSLIWTLPTCVIGRRGAEQ